MHFVRLEAYCCNYGVLWIIRADGGDARIIEKHGKSMEEMHG
jgi:hypothetical protein